MSRKKPVPEPVSEDQSALAPLKVLVAVLFAIVALRHAWLGDDAFITFRCVTNFAAGRGLVWNPDERVQVFTHPLWALVMCAAHLITGEIYHTAILLQVGFAVAAAWVILGFANTRPAFALATLGLFGTKGFLEWSSGGLENSLTHLLLLLFAREALSARPRELALGGWAGLLLFNRLDAGLFVVPYLLWRGGRSALRVLAVAAVLPGAWMLWSFFYYGFFLPNTAYAKLGHGLEAYDLFRQGVVYFSNALIRDPGTPFVIAAGLALAALRRHTDAAAAGLALGMVAYFAYLLRIGGDFMTGRMLSAPFALALALAVRALPAGLDGALLIGALAAALWAPAPLFLHMADYTSGVQDNKGIADEAKFYGRDTGFVIMNRYLGRSGTFPNNAWAWDGRMHETAGEPYATGACGFAGFNAGTLHVVDKFGLCDPLLARLPAMYNPMWRIGHHERALPAGYLETLKTGQDSFQDKKLGEYYSLLRQVVSGPLFSLERLKLALAFNFHAYDHLIDREKCIYPEVKLVAGAMVTTPRAPGAAWNAPGHVQMRDFGAKVLLSEPSHAKEFEISLDNNDFYRVMFLRDGVELARLRLGPRIAPGGLMIYRETVPPEARDRGFDAVWVLPLGYDGCYALGHLILKN